jgi:hypothetical protein
MGQYFGPRRHAGAAMELLSGATSGLESDLPLLFAFDTIGQGDMEQTARTLIDRRGWPLAMLAREGLQAVSANPLIDPSWLLFEDWSS